MAENARAFTAIGSAQIDAEGRQWIEVMPTATEARNGPYYFTVTRSDLDVYAQSISDNPGKIAVDYDHEGEHGGSTRAAGWFTGQARVEDRDGEAMLLAEVQWTPSALEAIKTGEYRFTSAVFNFEERDRKTGLMTRAKDLASSTLTNKPFFKQLAALAAVEADDDERVQALAAHFEESPAEIFTVLADSTMPYGDVLYADPGYQADKKKRYPLDNEEHCRAAWSYINQARNAGKYTPEQLASIKSKIRVALEKLGADVTATDEGAIMELKLIAAALGLPEDADEATVLAATKKAREEADRKAHRRGRSTNGGTMDLGAFAEALGLDDSVDEATVLAAVRKAAEDSDRVSTLEDEHEGLTATAREKLKLEQRVKTIEAERRAERIQRILTDGVRDGQVLPAEKQVLAKNFAENPDGLLEVINTRPKRSWAEIGSGDGLEDSVDVQAAKQRFESEEADGVDQDSVRLHVRAEQWLAERGKKSGTYTDLEYAQACDAVAREHEYVR